MSYTVVDMWRRPRTYPWEPRVTEVQMLVETIACPGRQFVLRSLGHGET